MRTGRCEIAVALQWNEEVQHPCTCAARALSDFFEHIFFCDQMCRLQPLRGTIYIRSAFLPSDCHSCSRLRVWRRHWSS